MERCREIVRVGELKGSHGSRRSVGKGGPWARRWEENGKRIR